MGVFDVWLGPLLAGTLATVFLLGFVLLEGRAYFRSSKKDGIWLKLLVCYIIIAELFITAALIALIWMFLIDDFDNPFALLTTPWMLHAEPLLAACVSLPVQLFFAQRVVILYHRPWFGVGIGAVSIIIFGLGVVITVLLSHNTDALLPTNINNLIHDIGAVAISLHLVNDVIISGSLVWYLHTNRTGIQRSDMLIDDIVRLTIQTGSLTALVVIVLLILNSAYMGNQSNSMSAIAYMPLSKFYSLSLLVTLNARQGWSFGSTNSRMWDTAAVAAQMSGLGPTNAPGAGDAMAANGDIHLPPGIVAIIPSSPDIERRAGEESAEALGFSLSPRTKKRRSSSPNFLGSIPLMPLTISLDDAMGSNPSDWSNSSPPHSARLTEESKGPTVGQPKPAGPGNTPLSTCSISEEHADSSDSRQSSSINHTTTESGSGGS